MFFNHSKDNLLELSFSIGCNLLAYFTTSLKDHHIKLSKKNELKLFAHMPKNELQSLLNLLTLSLLEKEYQYFYYCLKCLSKSNISCLIDLGILPK